MAHNLLAHWGGGKPEQSLRVFILSNIRLLAEGLVQALERDDKVSTCWCCTDFPESLARISDLQPELVLLDSALQEGPEAVRHILRVEPQAKVVVFGVTETSDDIIAWAQ